MFQRSSIKVSSHSGTCIVINIFAEYSFYFLKNSFNSWSNLGFYFWDMKKSESASKLLCLCHKDSVLCSL